MKLLKTIFIILLLITLGELGYYVYVINGGGLNAKLATNQPNLARDSESVLSQDQITKNTQRPEDALVSQQILDFIGALKKNPNQKFHLKTETNGFVGGIDELNDKRYYVLKIVDSQGKKIMNYVLAKDKAVDSHFYLVEGDKKTAITINDIKVKDKIAVEDEHEVRDNIIVVNFFIYR